MLGIKLREINPPELVNYKNLSPQNLTLISKCNWIIWSQFRILAKLWTLTEIKLPIIDAKPTAALDFPIVPIIVFFYYSY